MNVIQDLCNSVYSCADFIPKDVFDEINKIFKTVKMEYKFLDREKELMEVKQ